MKAGWGSGCIAGNFRLYVNGFFIARSQSWVATKTPPMGAVGVCQSDNWLEQNSTRLSLERHTNTKLRTKGATPMVITVETTTNPATASASTLNRSASR